MTDIVELKRYFGTEAVDGSWPALAFPDPKKNIIAWPLSEAPGLAEPQA